MASTNHTTNYNLSQYIGGDKPTYLGDYNGDMQKIDAQMKTNADNIATAISGVESATSTANSAVSTATSAQTTANSASSTATQASTTASNAQSTANSALSTATSAQAKANEVDEKVANFNLTSFETIAYSSMSKTGNGTINSLSSINVAKNSDGSLAKIYGNIQVDGQGNGVITIPTSLRPESSLTIQGVCLKAYSRNNNIIDFGQVSMTIATNGNVTINYNNYETSDAQKFIFTACLLFVKDFGDTPTPESN